MALPKVVKEDIGGFIIINCFGDKRFGQAETVFTLSALFFPAICFHITYINFGSKMQLREVVGQSPLSVVKKITYLR